MNRVQAQQIKWDIVDHLLANFSEGEMAVADYTQEDREYAQKQIRRIAEMLKVRNHIDL